MPAVSAGLDELEPSTADVHAVADWLCRESIWTRFSQSASTRRELHRSRSEPAVHRDSAFQPRPFSAARLLDVLFLDVAVAADGVGDLGDLHRQRRAAAASGRPGDRASRSRRSAGARAALGGVAEQIQRRAAQALQPCQHAEAAAASSGRTRFFSAGRRLVALAKIGGARWNESVKSPSNFSFSFLGKLPSV